MLEAMMMGGGGTIYYESGPGIQLLTKGSLEAGFFGEVSSAELFSTTQLSQEVGFLGGTTVEEYPVWLKFAYRGKFLFIPKVPIKSFVYWAMLYNAGLVYGTNDNGPLEASIPEKGVNQFKLAIKGNHRFVVRLMRSFDRDPSLYNAGFTDADFVGTSEWNTLMYRISNQLTGAQVGAKWAEYTSEALGLYESAVAVQTLCQEHSANLAYSISRGGATPQYGTVSNKNTGNDRMRWRPVLELLPADYLVPDAAFTYTTDLTLKQLSIATGYAQAEADKDIVPAGLFTATNDLSEPPILPDGQLGYLVGESVLQVTTPIITGDNESVAYPAAKTTFVSEDADLVLADGALHYLTDALKSPTPKIQSVGEILPPGLVSFEVFDDSIPTLADSLTVKNLSGFDPA